MSLENRVRSLLCLHGIYDFKPRLKKAEQALERLRTRAGEPLPPETMAALRRAMTRLRLIGEQIDEINAARAADAKAAAEAVQLEGQQRMIHFLTGIVGVGVETATRLVREVFCRPFRDRRGVAAFVGLTGTPFQSGGSEREQGAAKNGDKRIRGLLLQLTWRWLRFQPDSVLSKWFSARVAGGSGRIRKIMIVVLARKLLVALWRGVHKGVVPEGARLAGAAA